LFQAMISPAPNHVIPLAEMMSKTLRPSSWVWLK
jgi:hypothetical protein